MMWIATGMIMFTFLLGFVAGWNYRRGTES